MKRWIEKGVDWIRNLKYRRKLNLVLILVGLLPVIIIGGYMIYGFRELLGEKEYESMEVSLNQASATIDKQLEIYSNLLNYIVFDRDLQEILDREQTQDYASYSNYVNVVDPILNTPKFYHDSIKKITIFSEDIKIPHDITLAPLADIQGKNWFKQLRQASDAIWVWPDENHDEILAIRSFPGYRTTEAYLGIYCELNRLMEPLQYFEKEGAGILLVDEKNQTLFCNALGDEESEVQGVEEIESSYRYMKRRIQDLPLYIYIYMGEEAIYSGFYEMLGRIVFVVIVSLLSILIISRAMSGLLVKRIENLTTCVNQMDTGNMKINVEDRSLDEVGILIRSFHKMLNQIQRLISEVYQSKITQQELEMQALQAQINPHFLYNTLSMINWKAISAGEEDISKITLALSDFYRTTLNKGNNFITIAGEVLNIKSYLEIQLMMHDYEFEVEYQIDESVGSYQMPKLILQPLVENVLEHGLDMKEDGEKRLVLSCQQNQEDVVWTVQDNGVGMNESMVSNLVKTHATGYGVKNVNDRLALLYGESYVLHIESYPGEGTRVKIHIPKDGPVVRRGVSDEHI